MPSLRFEPRQNLRNEVLPNMKNKLIFILFALLILPSVTAVIENELAFKINTLGDLRRPCFDDNYYCDNTFICNVTISKNDGTNLITNARMTHNPTYYNISFTPTAYGYYNAIMVCYDGTDSGKDTFTFVVNNSGTVSTTGRLWAQVLAIFVLVALVSILIYYSVNSVKFSPLKYSLGIIAGILVFVILNLSISMLRDEIVDDSIITFFDKFAAMSVWIYYFAVGLIVVIWVFTILYNLSSSSKSNKARRIAGL